MVTDSYCQSIVECRTRYVHVEENKEIVGSWEENTDIVWSVMMVVSPSLGAEYKIRQRICYRIWVGDTNI